MRYYHVVGINAQLGGKSLAVFIYRFCFVAAIFVDVELTIVSSAASAMACGAERDYPIGDIII